MPQEYRIPIITAPPNTTKQNHRLEVMSMEGTDCSTVASLVLIEWPRGRGYRYPLVHHFQQDNVGTPIKGRLLVSLHVAYRRLSPPGDLLQPFRD